MWLIISSKAMRKRKNNYGQTDSIKWDLKDAIRSWDIKLWQKEYVSASYLKDFNARMAANGHSCHEVFYELSHWLYIQNVLFGESAGKVVNFMDRNLKCNACLR